ncbi:uncharacterized protein FIBRA_08617 [Fibroporia radiculosa]|uniref:FHA domain-containing protein n=1 Tax=Fibroporia radiculosa TaxID=599839 RepID=J4GX46_9APHY|nr:uncharacterized protein FIBRA_08617 [Fibroporia radiculosa]CCM06360.1 predicted protein [Fibroporia radiculosa]
MPAPFTTPHVPIPLPALYLYPLNDSFIPKHISLLNNQRVKIGRQTNAKTVPAERNGYFDSKVLSRQHAEVWEESGKIYIKDVKSSNGTFINGERLSAEGLESEPFELKTDDIVEFGIDIVGEDNKTIVHHKVAARVVCVFSEQDAQAAARAEASQNPPSYGSVAGQGSAGGAFNFVGGQQPGPNGAPGQQRRPSLQQQGLIGMGGMGGNVRPPGKSGLTFDHILSRLQGELQKSRDTSAELHSLTGAMNEIHDTLGGNLPPNLPPYPSTLPPVMPPQTQQQQEASQQPVPPAMDASALNEIQSQLRETQLSLATHVEKIRLLEGMLAEHEVIKREVSSMRELMEDRKREQELLRQHNSSPPRAEMRHEEAHEEQYMSDDDDARSIDTVVPHELERVDEEDEEQIAAEEEEEERRRRRDELGRPGTPEPTGMGMGEDDDEHESARQRAREQEPPRSPSPPSPVLVPVSAPSPSDDISDRLASLSKELETALELSRSLEAQHTTAQSTISLLESKVAALETLVHDTQSQVRVQSETTQQLTDAVRAVECAASSNRAGEEERARERESLTEMVNEWKKNVEGRWSSVQEEWSEERERLRRAKEEWELRVRAVEEGFGQTTSKVEASLVTLAAMQAQHFQPQPNGTAKLSHSGGLVTPPSPRSLSAESTRPRQRRKRTSASRGRTRSRSASTSTGNSMDAQVGSSTSSVSEEVSERAFPTPSIRHRSPWMTDDSSGSDSEAHALTQAASVISTADSVRHVKGMPFPITPESSVLNHPLTTSTEISGTATDSRTKEPPRDLFNNLSTAIGVLVLSAAAAAVIWRVKPETSL